MIVGPFFGGSGYRDPLGAGFRYGLLNAVLVSLFSLLFVANNFFNKPALAVMFLFYMLSVLPFFNQIAAWGLRSLSLFVLWVFFVSSYFWSLVPSVSVDIILTQSAFIFLAFFVSFCQNVDGFYKQIRLAVLIVLPIVLLFSLMFPHAAYTSVGLNSIYPHKNSLGAFMALSALVLFFSPGRRAVHVLFGILAIGLLVASRSKTSIILFVLCCFSSVVMNKIVSARYSDKSSRSIAALAGSVFFYACCAALVAMVLFRDFLIDFAWAEFSKSFLTGRGTLWLIVIQQIRMESLLGIGPGVFWQAGYASEIAKTTLYYMDPYWVQRMISADGSYIDIVASIGVLGLSLFLFSIVDLFRGLWANWDRSDSKLIFCLAGFVVFQGVTESTILYSTNALWFVYLMCYFRVVGYRFVGSIKNKEKARGADARNV